MKIHIISGLGSGKSFIREKTAELITIKNYNHNDIFLEY
ncbi:hypothetical protein KP78_37890 [Jeotgalibacillus soli]|uniref:Uncharacterized protein n=1 Tax=Jeotgalibacillus soli TaxID=889306 RepID=A0A0C2R0Y6_9BACL|nr:hypothetical protein KP78_37890 [Jeotgalibacillus soli]